MHGSSENGHVSRACLMLDGHVAWSWAGQK